MKKVSVLLTPGGGPGILAQVASLRASRKYEARIIMADANPASGNLFLPEIDAAYVMPPCDSPDYLPAMLRLVDKENLDVIYSGLDEEMPVLAENRSTLEDAGVHLVLPPAPALRDALDKKATHARLEGKVRMPETYFLDEDFDADAVYRSLGGRVLIKVVDSRGGRHIYIPEDEEEYRFFLGKTARLTREKGMRFMLQRLITGQEYNVTSLHDLSGKMVYAISRRKFENRQVKSTTTAAVIERRDDVIEQALSAVANMGLTPGFNNVESIVSDEDDKPWFIEINGGRTAAQDMNVVASGVNITDFLLDLAFGVHVEPIPHPEDGVCILKIRKDVVTRREAIASVPAA